MDHLLVRGGEADVRNDGSLLGGIENGRTLAKVEQQPLDRQRRNYSGGHRAIES